MIRAYMCMKISEYPPPPPPSGGKCLQRQKTSEYDQEAPQSIPGTKRKKHKGTHTTQYKIHVTR